VVALRSRCSLSIHESGFQILLVFSHRRLSGRGNGVIEELAKSPILLGLTKLPAWGHGGEVMSQAGVVSEGTARPRGGTGGLGVRGAKLEVVGKTIEPEGGEGGCGQWLTQLGSYGRS